MVYGPPQIAADWYKEESARPEYEVIDVLNQPEPAAGTPLAAAAHPAPAAPPRFLQLRLIVAGVTGRSLRAIAALRRICEAQPGCFCDIEVIDIYQQPALAAQYQATAAPTLIRLHPLPVRRIVGDLSGAMDALRDLDLADAGPHHPPVPSRA